MDLTDSPSFIDWNQPCWLFCWRITPSVMTSPWLSPGVLNLSLNHLLPEEFTKAWVIKKKMHDHLVHYGVHSFLNTKNLECDVNRGSLFMVWRKDSGMHFLSTNYGHEEGVPLDQWLKICGHPNHVSSLLQSKIIWNPLHQHLLKYWMKLS